MALMPPCFKLSNTDESGLRIFEIETTLKPDAKDEEYKIQIRTIGQENNMPTKALLLVGQTGEGKSTLINGMLNYLYNVQIEDDFRYIVKDEIGNPDKSSAVSQTEFVTGYLIYHQPGMRFECNLLLIDTPGFGDTRGKEMQTTIRQQMEVFLRQDKFGVDELHCLGLVMNGTINRAHPYLKGILTDFISLFGSDTIEATKVLATNCSDEPSVGPVLKNLGIDIEKMYPFDNGVLFKYVPESDRDCKKKLRKITPRWEEAQEQYDSFFADLMVSTPVSLKLTREAMYEKENFVKSLLSLRMNIDSSLNMLLDHKNKENSLKGYEAAMSANKTFECEETRTVKVRRPTNCRTGHAHNCYSCDRTCVKHCYRNFSLYLFCPANWKERCGYCECLSTYHKRENEYIVENLVREKVTNAEMKARYTDAEKLKEDIQKSVKELEEKLASQLGVMAKDIKQIVNHVKRINEICRKKEKPVNEHIHELIEDIKQAKFLQLREPSDRDFIEGILNALPEKVAEMKDEGGGLTNKLKNMCSQVIKKGKEAMGQGEKK